MAGSRPAKRQRLESDLFTKGQQWDEIELKFDDGQSLYTSKGFLACVSPVFDRMFRTECKEVMDNCIEMKGKDREMFKKILLRLHPNSQKPLAVGETIKALMIADEYQIDLLREVCENFIVQFLNSELTKLNHMSDLQKNAVLKKGLSLLSLTKTYSSNKIAFSAYQLISAFSTETIVQHPAFKVLSDAYKNKVLLYRLARADKYGSITAYKLSEVPSFIAQTDEHCSAN